MAPQRFIGVGSAAILAVILVAGTGSCDRPYPASYIGHAGPDGELDVAFHGGVAKTTAVKVVQRCTAHNSIVIRTTPVRLRSSEPRHYGAEVIAANSVSVDSRQAKRLLSCFTSDPAVEAAAWPA